MEKRSLLKDWLSPLAAALNNLLVAMLLLGCCRLVFFLQNRPLFPEVDGAALLRLCRGGLRFDLTAVLYTNLPYLLLAMLPFRFREGKRYRSITKGVFVVPNFLMLAIDLADSVYFAYTNRRTTSTVFEEFRHDDNIAQILLHEAAAHWYLVLLGAAFLAVLILAYKELRPCGRRYGWKDYLAHSALVLALLYPLVGGLRGGFGATVRPLSLNDVTVHIDKPLQAGIVLNTAFSLYRTLGSAHYEDPHWYPDEASLEAVFTPIHPAFEGPMQKKNVVIVLLESFSASYSGLLTGLQGEARPGYMPFLDSLAQEGLFCRYSFANGRISIDALPSVMCGVPSLLESFTLTPYAQDQLQGIAHDLRGQGYSTAFFHGAKRESMALAGSAHNTGFEREYSRTDYADDRDYDGTWAIWDEPFLQYFKKGLDGLQEPFLGAVFTASSHHPFALPRQYEGVYPEGTQPIHRTVAYADDALRRFFREAQHAPWYANTVFVLTGDHTNQTDLPEYLTSAGLFEIPIVFYAPDGSLKGFLDGVAQQLDIKPTLYHCLSYPLPYFSFGCDLLATPEEESDALFTLNGIYHYCRGNWLLQFDGERSVGLYRFREDRLLQNNLLDTEAGTAAALEGLLKARIQQYMARMVEDRMAYGL